MGIGLSLHFFALQNVAELDNEQVEGTAVEYQVVDIQQQVYAALCLGNLHPAEHIFAQVERPYESLLILLELSVGKSMDGDIDICGHIALHDIVALCLEMYEDMFVGI